MLTTENLLQEYKERQVAPEITRAMDLISVSTNGHVVGGDYFAPSPALAGIVEVMGLVEPSGSIDELEALTTDAIPIDSSAPFSEQILARLINDTLHISELDPEILQFTKAVDNTNPGACSDAELLFAATILQHTEEVFPEHLNPAILFRDEANGKPVFLQKFHGADSALGLESIAIDGTLYPAGTLYSLYSDLGKRFHRKYVARKTPPLFPPKFRIEEQGTSEVRSLSPLRLSMWALPPNERYKIVVNEGYVPDIVKDRVFSLIEQAEIFDLAAMLPQ